MDIRDRLYGSSIRTSKGCLEYSRFRNAKGYGQISYQNKRYLTHRLSWILTNGAIPDGMLVLHKCDNPPCIEPKHLWIGDAGDNSIDMLNKQRNRSNHSKLTRADAEKIRELSASGTPRHILSADYDVTETTIAHIINRRTWR